MKLKSTENLKALGVLSCLNAQVRPAKASHPAVGASSSVFLLHGLCLGHLHLGVSFGSGDFCCLAELQGRI
ncbi:hypothetical protein ACRRTK_008944 [Alexandromys fortis]